MRCKTCEYPLWNLRARTCPECGTPFLPSDYEFTLNSVRFMCPHCAQPYYGTGDKGHLVPPTFACVSCGQTVAMNDMVLLPTEGVEEERTRVEDHPWLVRARIGRFKAWFRTLGMAMFMPGRLARLGGEDQSGQALWFALVANAIFLGCSLGLALLLMIIVAISSGGGPGSAGAILPFFLFTVGTVVGFIILVGIWGALAHGLLVITGRTHGGMSRTYSAICYGSAANLLVAVPCLGTYMFPVSLVWWLVASIIMVRSYQGVSGWRASLAVIPAPALLIAGFAALIIWVFAAAMGSVATSRAQLSPQITCAPMAAALTAYPAAHAGAWPPHATALFLDGLSVNDFIKLGSVSNAGTVPVAGSTLLNLSTSSVATQATMVNTAAALLPPNTIAHRVGDYVFTYHGVSAAAPDPRLWIAIASPDPKSNPVPPPAASGTAMSFLYDQAAILADGAIVTIPIGQMAARLSAQNNVRAELGLPPLPDPATVTHAKPATAGP